MSRYNVAVVGASGVVGETLLSLLNERSFPVDQVYAIGSARSAGDLVAYAKRSLEINDIETFDWSLVDIAFFSAGSQVSKQWVPQATAAGCVCIDNTSAFRDDPEVPLVIPEVNVSALSHYATKRIVANPNCSTIQMLVALKPIHDRYGIQRIDVSTYQSVSGAGKEGINALSQQCVQMLQGKPADNFCFDHPIAFNLLPKIDEYVEDGYTREEMKMVWESQKILEAPDLEVNATAVRVPVFFGHSESIYIETEKPMELADVQTLLAGAPGVQLLSDEYPMPVPHGSGRDDVYVGRLRRDRYHQHGLNLWVVADNVRKGAALNSLQIAECLIEKGLK
ncbi:MAG: aspartate-semialdehyde dehydrogenase [Shewanellaceae bacterium]|nr:aspartate-semialdehyde dehydrogenase [Shewanellaceae bacterium]